MRQSLLERSDLQLVGSLTTSLGWSNLSSGQPDLFLRTELKFSMILNSRIGVTFNLHERCL